MGVAGYFRLSADDARRIVGEVAAAVGQWQGVAASHGLSAAEIARMQSAFTELASATGL